MEKEYDWLWLCSNIYLTDREKRKLLGCFKEPGAIRRAKAETLEKTGFLNTEKVRIIQKYQNMFDAAAMYHKWSETGIQFISSERGEYPYKLRQISDYPLGLFYCGRLPAEEETCIAVVGARMCTGYGREMAEKLGSLLAENGVSVISGLAYGIDAIAQYACVRSGGISYGVPGCGPDICYPNENRSVYERVKAAGGIISEYPPGTAVKPWQFPARNRIISGLCDKLVVVEAKKKSGTLITADFALEQGRDVYAVPGRISDSVSAGCNRLIAQGAGIIADTETFMEELGVSACGMEKGKKSDQILATPENMVYICVDSRLKSLQEIIDETGMSVPEAVGALYSLKAKGLIEETEKNYYRRHG